MQNIILKKSSESHLFSHIYEHIYSIALDTEMRQSGLFPVMNYDIAATTESGVVNIEIEWYGHLNIHAYLEHIDSNDAIIDEYLDTAIAQVAVEKGRHIATSDRQLLQEQLVAFHHISWGDHSNVKVDVSLANAMSSPSYRVTARYPELELELLPFYRLVMGIILNVIADDLADSYAGFVRSKAYAVNSSDELELSISFHPRANLSGMKALIDNTFMDVLHSQSILKFLAELQDTNTMEYPPSSTFKYRDIKIQMSPDKWRAVATKENLVLIEQVGRIILKRA